MAKVLLTGGSGFLGSRILLQLLDEGHTVRTTVRSAKSEAATRQLLEEKGATNLENLSFAIADLSADAGWAEAMDGMDYVLSVASPVFFEIPKDEEEMIRPARDGVLRVLRAAKSAGIKRVVMTSNFGAVGFSKLGAGQLTTEVDWTDPNQPGLSVYEKSKLLAEKGAWEFMRTEGGDMEFATVNPVAIFGPSLNEHVSASFNLLKGLLTGSMKVVPNIPLNVVDVRDVADAHVKALFTPDAAGHRFILSAPGQISLPEIAELIKRERPEAAGKVSSRRLPTAVLKLRSYVNPMARERYLLARINRNVSTQAAEEILGWTARSQEEATLAAVDSLVEYGLV